MTSCIGLPVTFTTCSSLKCSSNIFKSVVYYIFSTPFIVFVGLPVQVRDAALQLQDDMPKSDVGKEYYMQNVEREVRITISVTIHLFNSNFTGAMNC